MQNNNTKSKQRIKRVTNLEKQRQRERNRKKALARKIRKYLPLCVSKGFIKYAYRKGWDDETVDAAALIMHRLFMMRKQLNRKRWIPIPYQTFKVLFGKHYKRIKDKLIKDGFLEYNHWRNYLAGEYCLDYRICRELRYDRITASYRLQSKVLQERFIKTKEYWRGMSKAERRKRAIAIFEDKFFVPTDADANDKCKSYYSLVQEGHLTEIEFATIERLSMNAHSLDVQISENELIAVIEKGYEKNRNKNDTDCTSEAYEHWMRNMYSRLQEPRVSVKPNGRFYVPLTNMPSVLWNYTYLKQNQLSAIDVKSSHV